MKERGFGSTVRSVRSTAAFRPFTPSRLSFLTLSLSFLYTLTKDDQPLAAAARYQYALNTTLSIFLSFC